MSKDNQEDNPKKVETKNWLNFVPNLLRSKWIISFIVAYFGIYVMSTDSKILVQKEEEKILKYCKSPVEGNFVELKHLKIFSSTEEDKPLRIWTLLFNPTAQNTPLVLLHGLCASAGLWALNADSFAESRPVYALDVLGFGRSSRPTFSKDAEEVIEQYVEALEAWRKEVGLEKFILLGHSMGAYLSAAYALKYPERIVHLILADPWGFSQMTENSEKSTFFKMFATFLQYINFTPMKVVRAMGPLGPKLISTFRSDLVRKFKVLNQNGNASVAEYMYHSNALNPTGEAAFVTLMDLFAWAKLPMIQRLSKDFPSNVSISVIVGGKTWVPQLSQAQWRNALPQNNVEIHIINGAGHHVYADDITNFHRIVNNVGLDVDMNNNKR